MFFIKMCSKIESALTRQELIGRLYKITNSNNKENDLFLGQINDNGFKIYKKPKEYVRNSFMPIIVGEFEEKKDGCNINVTARLNHFTAIFLIIWSLGAIILPLIIGFIQPLFFIASIVFSAFLIILLVFAFYKPAKKTIYLLNSILIK